MTLGDRIGDAAEHLAGAAKEAAGRVTGDERLQEEGRIDAAAARAKERGEDLPDAPV